jgi:hypothetical protein
VHDPERPRDDEEPSEFDWDAWERGLTSGPNRWRLVFMLVILAAMIAAYVQTGGEAIPWGPP